MKIDSNDMEEYILEIEKLQDMITLMYESLLQMQ